MRLYSPDSDEDRGVCPAHETPIEAELLDSVHGLEPARTALSYWRQQELVVLEHFIPGGLLGRMKAEAQALEGEVVRRQVGSFKKAGAVGHFALARSAPAILALYRSRVLIDFLSELAELPLLTCPDRDPHACALYRYDSAGDHVGFHYDTSWYEGARFTVLIGLVDRSTARLRCRLYNRELHRPTRDLDVATRPGTLVFFNGDKLLHAVTPLGAGETRVVLTLQYVTSRAMRPWKRLVSNLKDSVAYFGFGGGNRPGPALLPAQHGSEEAP